MGRRKGTPATSKLVRAPSPAFSRRQRPGSEPKPEDKTPADEVTQTEGQPLAEAADIQTQPMTVRPDPKDVPPIVPPEPGAEPWPDATPAPMKPVAAPSTEADDIARPRTSTVAMPVPANLGRPPDMPKVTAPPPLGLGLVENPAHMPGPKEVPSGNPDDPAPAPGVVPPGDSRSLRKDDQFALIYRVGTCVITRTGLVGTRGQWRVVEYPTSLAASNSYAKECSRFVSDGFSDYRE